ncbi:UPF0481 protein [Cocos nucifera]|uniref:UPF0481 protein n=1 Tax=Cocos nucifera TaxID=13894 RepID=A0A8K0NCE8_COCNU|nr:UPF0481 protein [Cocos nucifera]
MDVRHGVPSSAESARGNHEVGVENLDNSEAAWIEEVHRNIEAASVWTPPWANQERAGDESNTNPSILRVPTRFKEQNPEHYGPKVVAIGPYHRDNSELLIKDEAKWWCVNQFVSQYSLNLPNWLLHMTSREREARSYYSEDVSMDRHSFLEMLLLDGCFIFMAFKAMRGFKFDLEWPSDQIMLDLLMLENQIPFFVLLQIYDGIGGEQGFRKFTGGSYGPIIAYALSWLDQTKMRNVQDPPNIPDPVLPLLHLFHLYLHPARFNPDNIVRQKMLDHVFPTPTVVPSATGLHDRSAVNFKKVSGSILDITFRNGVMKIPFLELNDGVKTILHNLIAFEQCYRQIEPRVTTYAEFMNCLINKESDADLLESCGILLNRLPTSNDAAFFFSKLSPRAKIRSIYLKSLTAKVKIYHEETWNRWRADLKLNYFSNPWVTISVLAATALLILTFMQTYYSARS